jgi:hypothetical protein
VADKGDDLLTVLRRELGAIDVRVADAGSAEVKPPLELACEIGDRAVVARFAEAPADPAATTARLELLVQGFRDLIAAEAVRPSRPPPLTLHDALAALAERAGACDALVIDAHSPIVWGTGAPDDRVRDAGQVIPYSNAWRALPGADELLRNADKLGVSPAFEVDPEDAVAQLIPRSLCARHRIAPLRAEGRSLDLAMADPSDSSAVHAAALATGMEIEPVAALEVAIASFAQGRAPDLEIAEPTAERRAHADQERASWARHLASRRAVPIVRALPEIAMLPKGGHLHAAHAEPGFGYVARSFAGIYVLILVFEGPFDEIGARRATQSALPAIERLVLSLPPRDPSTQGARVAVAIRRLRRR